MPDYRSMYDRDYIGHFDLPGGKDMTLTIKRVVGGELTAMGGRKSKKPIVHFKEDVKPLICNKTNAKTIAAMYGNMVEGWAGQRITLFVSTTRNPDGGGEVECIRVRPKIPDGGAQFEEPEPQGADAGVVAKINEGLAIAPPALKKKFEEKLASMDVTDAAALDAEAAAAALKWLNTQLDKLAATQP